MKFPAAYGELRVFSILHTKVMVKPYILHFMCTDNW